jgi:hypothetical protein
MGNVVFLPLAALAFSLDTKFFRFFPRPVAGNYRITTGGYRNTTGYGYNISIIKVLRPYLGTAMRVLRNKYA